MPLWLLGAIVVVGLALVWVALKVFGFATPLVLDEATARAEFIADNPGQTPDRIMLATSGQAALVDVGDALYIIWVMGADVATRRLQGAIPVETPTGLSLFLPDYAAPKVAVTLKTDEIALWRSRIEETA